RRYLAHAWGAFAGLVVFLVLYFGLAGWFGWVALRWFRGAYADTGPGLGGILFAIPPAFLCAFLLTRLLRRGDGAPDGVSIEIGEADQPDLVAFVHRVADEAGAPRPYRILLV